MLQQIKRTGSRCLLLVPLGLIVLLFECVPLVSMFVKAFSENGHFSLAQFGTIAHQLVYRTAIINSLWVTLLSTAVGLVSFMAAPALGTPVDADESPAVEGGSLHHCGGGEHSAAVCRCANGSSAVRDARLLATAPGPNRYRHHFPRRYG